MTWSKHTCSLRSRLAEAVIELMRFERGGDKAVAWNLVHSGAPSIAVQVRYCPFCGIELETGSLRS